MFFLLLALLPQQQGNSIKNHHICDLIFNDSAGEGRISVTAPVCRMPRLMGQTNGPDTFNEHNFEQKKVSALFPG